jgi:hypothetical protein
MHIFISNGVVAIVLCDIGTVLYTQSVAPKSASSHSWLQMRCSLYPMPGGELHSNGDLDRQFAIRLQLAWR